MQSKAKPLDKLEICSTVSRKRKAEEVIILTYFRSNWTCRFFFDVPFSLFNGLRIPSIRHQYASCESAIYCILQDLEGEMAVNKRRQQFRIEVSNLEVLYPSKSCGCQPTPHNFGAMITFVETKTIWSESSKTLKDTGLFSHRVVQHVSKHIFILFKFSFETS